MRAPGALYLMAIHHLGAGPPLGGPQDYHGPPRPLNIPAHSGLILNFANLDDAMIQRGSHGLVHRCGFGPLHPKRLMPQPAKHVFQFIMLQPGKDAGIADLVTIQVQNRKDRPISGGI